MAKSFTDKYIAWLKPKEKPYFIREKRGFTIQVLPSGQKSFVYLFELNKKKGYVLLGHYPDCSLQDARLEYNNAYDLVKRQKIDPRVQRKIEAEEQAKAAQKELEETEAAARAIADKDKFTFQNLLQDGIPDDYVPATVAQLAAAWVVLYSRRNHAQRWQETALSCISKHILPAFGDWEISAVRHKHAISLIERIAADAPGAARNTNKIGRQMFKYACAKEWSETQPFHEITESVPVIAPKSDERNLDDHEIVRAWAEIGDSASSLSVKRALKLVLVTAQRPGEVIQMHRDQINGRWWTIPAEVTKNGREHRVYLTDTALALVGDATGHIFASERSERGHVSENTLSQAINRGYLTEEVEKVVGNRKIKARKDAYFGMRPWSPHDLRRTARTNMPRVGIADEIAEEVLNHKKRGVVGVYNKYKYDKEKRVALLKWEVLLLQILNNEVTDDAELEDVA